MINELYRGRIAYMGNVQSTQGSLKIIGDVKKNV